MQKKTGVDSSPTVRHEQRQSEIYRRTGTGKADHRIGKGSFGRVDVGA